MATVTRQIEINAPADAVATLVATPTGERPLRTLVGRDAVAATYLNQVAEQTQSGFLVQMSMSDLTQVAAPESLAA